MDMKTIYRFLQSNKCILSDTRIWPRAAAVAERLWRNPNTPVYTAEPRLQNLRSKLVARGLRPDVLSPGWCRQNDNKCL